MKISLKQRQETRLRLRMKTAIIVSAGFLTAVFFGTLFIGNVGTVKTSKAAAPGFQTIDSGSYIIDMGQATQTVANGLVPYGMVYDLVKNYSTPVKWVINQSKVKDGTDFTYNLVNYRGGPFIIPAAYITPIVQARITYWNTRGVKGLYTTSTVDVPTYSELTAMPTMFIDNSSGKQSIIENYFIAAEIPATAYIEGVPSQLGTCSDLWINPHGDPTWSSHSYLYNFAILNGSFVFSACHATSMMEGCKNTVAPFEQLNFLTTNGLKCYSAGKCQAGITETHGGNSTPPYVHYYPSDPMMQFIGPIDAPLSGGSEDWYQPQSTSAWRPTTRRCITTSDGVAPNEGILMAYGPAYGLANAGWVMYEAGHDFGGTGTAAVAAQRAFLNFMIFAASKKSVQITSYNIGSSFNPSSIDNISVTVNSGTPPYSFQWKSSVSGVTFGSPNSASTTIKIPPASAKASGLITVDVVDACSRKNFLARPFKLGSFVLPVVLSSFTAALNSEKVVQLNWSTASEKDNDYFTIERSADGFNFTELMKVKGAGNSNKMLSYAKTDIHPLVGNSYYRLKQTDYNGKSETFRTVSIRTKATEVSGIKVFPNPFNGTFSAEFESPSEGNMKAQLFSPSGLLMHSETINVTEGHNDYKFQVNKPLTTGSYIFRLTNGDDFVTAVKVFCEE